jgi:hypothetical protein
MAEEYAPGSFVLSSDPWSGTTQKMHITTDQKLVLETETNIDALAEENTVIRNDVSRTTASGDMVRVARLPLAVFMDLKQRGVVDDRAAMKRWLASDEALPFRVHWMRG